MQTQSSSAVLKTRPKKTSNRFGDFNETPTQLLTIVKASIPNGKEQEDQLEEGKLHEGWVFAYDKYTNDVDEACRACMDVVSTSAKFKKTQYPHYLFAVTVKNSGPCDLEKTKQKLLTKGYKRIFTKLVKAEVVGLNDYQLTYVFVWKPYELN